MQHNNDPKKKEAAEAAKLINEKLRSLGNNATFSILTKGKDGEYCLRSSTVYRKEVEDYEYNNFINLLKSEYPNLQTGTQGNAGINAVTIPFVNFQMIINNDNKKKEAEDAAKLINEKLKLGSFEVKKNMRGEYYLESMSNYYVGYEDKKRDAFIEELKTIYPKLMPVIESLGSAGSIQAVTIPPVNFQLIINNDASAIVEIERQQQLKAEQAKLAEQKEKEKIAGKTQFMQATTHQSALLAKVALTSLTGYKPHVLNAGVAGNVVEITFNDVNEAHALQAKLSTLGISGKVIQEMTPRGSLADPCLRFQGLELNKIISRSPTKIESKMITNEEIELLRDLHRSHVESPYPDLENNGAKKVQVLLDAIGINANVVKYHRQGQKSGYEIFIPDTEYKRMQKMMSDHLEAKIKNIQRANSFEDLFTKINAYNKKTHQNDSLSLAMQLGLITNNTITD
ncbi:MAG: hypothetical protein JO149_06405, partial [Gammaproteobacteria bacterium]|nr:hypothetical protein [Gammaproteobacteria bacterium]